MGHLRITVVEDNPADVRLLKEAFQEWKVNAILDVFPDGEQALQELFASAAEGRTPDLIILDLNLPGRSGHEVLQTVKSDPRTRRVPVLVMSSSSQSADINTSYEHHANCYIRKPMDLDTLNSIVRSIKEFWLNCVVLPSPGDAVS